MRDPELTSAVFSSQTFPLDRYHHVDSSSTHPYTPPPSFIMTEYVKVEKIIPKFPPPAFSDIAKASNDVCFGCLSGAFEGAIADLARLAYQQGLLPHCRWSDITN